MALGRKNALFAGSDGGARHWAIVASLVATAKLNGVEPLAWLTDVLERMVSGRTKAARARAAAALGLEGRAARGCRQCLKTITILRRSQWLPASVFKDGAGCDER